MLALNILTYPRYATLRLPSLDNLACEAKHNPKLVNYPPAYLLFEQEEIFEADSGSSQCWYFQCLRR